MIFNIIYFSDKNTIHGKCYLLREREGKRKRYRETTERREFVPIERKPEQRRKQEWRVKYKLI